jgi:hypothetical protein
VAHLRLCVAVAFEALHTYIHIYMYSSTWRSIYTYIAVRGAPAFVRRCRFCSAGTPARGSPSPPLKIKGEKEKKSKEKKRPSGVSKSSSIAYIYIYHIYYILYIYMYIYIIYV